MNVKIRFFLLQLAAKNQFPQNLEQRNQLSLTTLLVLQLVLFPFPESWQLLDLPFLFAFLWHQQYFPLKKTKNLFSKYFLSLKATLNKLFQQRMVPSLVRKAFLKILSLIKSNKFKRDSSNLKDYLILHIKFPK